MTELERLRREAGLSQTELAEKTGVGLTSIVKLEAGKDVKASVARRLAVYFKQPWPIFFADIGCNYSIQPKRAGRQ